MDTKLKSNEEMNKWNLVILFLALFVIPANWLYSNYWQTRLAAQNQQVNLFDTSDYYLNLNKITYDLYWELIGESDSLITDLAEINNGVDYENHWEFFEENVDTEYSKQQLTEQYVQSQIEEALDSFQKIRIANYQNLQYAAYHHQFEKILLNGSEQLQRLATGALTLPELTIDTQHLIQINYDEQGHLTVSSTQDRTDHLVWQNAIESHSDLFDWKPIKDTVFVFSIPSSLTYADEIDQFQTTNHLATFIDLMRWNIIVILGIVATIALLVPVRTMKDHQWFKQFLDWPVEITTIILILVLGVTIGIMPYTANQINHSMAVANATGWFGPFSNNFYVRLYVRILNIGIWVALFSILTCTILYFKNNRLNQKQGYRLKLITKTDLKEPYTIKLISFLGIQFLFISLINLTDGLGLFMGLVYCICLFLFLKKYLTKTQRDYFRILEITNKLSAKNVEAAIVKDEDLGLFNSLKERLTQFQLNLTELIEEHHKNQKFKKDLINYLSHEFRHPITAMIIEIERLKGEGLDRNSQQNELIKMEQQLSHLKFQVDHLCEMSKVGLGHYQLNLQQVDLVKLIQEAITEVENHLGQTQIILRTQFPDHLVLVNVDVSCMHQVFRKLLLNMEKYGLPGTRAYLNVIEDSKNIQIIFRNISVTEINQRAEELINQSENLKDGLKMIKNYVELQGGTFKIKLDGDLFKVIIILNKEKNVHVE